MEEISIRSAISKIAKPYEVARLSFLVSLVELGWPLINTIQFTILYNMTITYFPSAVHLMSLGYALAGFIMFIVLIVLMRKNVSYDPEEEHYMYCKAEFFL